MRHLETLEFIEAIHRAGSIRGAADSLSLTSTALNRRLLALEGELGAPIFERLPRGVRLSPAGELLIQHIRGQRADLERVRSQIADLKGERRGHVKVACSQALLPYFMPREISAYRAEHPLVTFSVNLRDRYRAERALVAHEADIALVFEPVRLADVQVLATAPQPVHAVMARSHPLAAKRVVRLSDLAAFPVGMPSEEFGVRYLLDIAMRRSSVKLTPLIESDSFEFLRCYPGPELMVTFQIPIGLPADDGREPIVTRPIDTRDVPAGLLYLAQMRGRTLPVAAANFARQLARALDAAEPKGE
ncbi:LysR family transcriptional regulator [Pseudoroseicyclus tamaricis]|uniref:LysR family transcriptional regulator n=1 Tax=Pseudoroseicyclus tamaricis TaxID=2705421 RepID=A0A6B2JPX4_9RHOB|nr:LysR family transcriptional regulator [Pseudoroseicyclus tamaricis]NDV00015.1 LysR family transcriptional regulator [Pseudoroseicyclus tamaricis]